MSIAPLSWSALPLSPFTFNVPLDVAGTPFQQAVWRALQAIPAGALHTYGAIARQLGNPQAVRAVGAAPVVRRAVWWLLGIELAQGAIGMVQYFTGLPELLVGAHLLGSAVLWIAVLAVGVALRERTPVPVDTLDGPSGSAPAPEPAPPAEVADAEQVLITAAVPEDIPPQLRGRRFTVADGEVTADG